MRQLLTTEDLSAPDIRSLMKLAENFDEVQKREVPKVPALRGKTVVLAFFEDSTRTRSSFDLAARRLSADVVNFSASSSSLSKGESLRDTVETITAMGVDAMIVRHKDSGVPDQISKMTSASVINAGDGSHQHPTQSLTDLFTLRKRFGDIAGKEILICGDIKNSRVARANIWAFKTMGANVTLVAPRTLLPPVFTDWGVKVSHDLDAVIHSTDVAYFLRVQKERMRDTAFPSDREYRALYGLTSERAARMTDGAVIMHPGPMNRGVELDPDVADLPNCLVRDQVANGVSVRMAVLYSILGPGQFDGEEVDDIDDASDRSDPEVNVVADATAQDASAAAPADLDLTEPTNEIDVEVAAS